MYVKFLEKITVIKALIFSNHATANLTLTIDENRLPALLQNAAHLADHGYDLKTGRFEYFSGSFCRENGLGTLNLTRLRRPDFRKDLYKADLQTCHGNSISADSDRLHCVLEKLARRTINDLVAAEYKYRTEKSAENLLYVSSRLSTLAHTLDDGFNPEEALRPESRAEKELKKT
ncbi:MAG: hypothetical protein K9G62_04405 [Alphaproteobacteria bacterium]|nr:hypothetical protein [Alphaproteobacteria bacterium]